ncbi:hypothetical protein A2U01_0052432, partial [Trifolium medium]|nr:hypothetical protein [Trifolium medium]
MAGVLRKPCVWGCAGVVEFAAPGVLDNRCDKGSCEGEIFTTYSFALKNE